MNTTQIIQVIVAVATLALAGVAFWQIQLARRQVVASEEAAKAAADSAETARRAVSEAARARSEARAPSVIALLEKPSWPPLLDINRNGMPGGGTNELRLLDPM